MNGGTTRWFVLLSSFLAWTQKESRIPAALGNICEGSSYLWIAPITLILLGRLKLRTSRNGRWGRFGSRSAFFRFGFFTRFLLLLGHFWD